MSTDTVRREVVLPATPDEVWEAITLPEALRDWFGAEVDWDVRPGGPGQFREEDGTVREARVAHVDPGHHLAFTWWPEGREGEASRVDYDLEEVEWGTRLVVTETQARTRPVAPVASMASASMASASAWDGRLLWLSLRAGALVPA
jgi:uncharacterized protein YndB with AHSA1/START domain